eukprot:TRINITY_DN29206_c0_g1_i1.p1 TRINITY_DN29206_c0_g1~~TRINITY_DN29206_c0_g1_i1.p1  ORF type:complete len:594 (-),score=170.04 TRINITY_DN29206_c0_g1_i1:407-2188(-)
METGVEALHQIKESEPPQWLAASPRLREATRSASTYLFSELLPSVPKCPLPALLTDNFDAEQIWMQLDLQARPLLSSLRPRLKTLETNLDTLIPPFSEPEENQRKLEEKSEDDAEPMHSFTDEDEDDDGSPISSDEGESDDDNVEGFSADDNERNNEDDDKGEDHDEAAAVKSSVEDEFLKINDLVRFLNEAEEEENLAREKQGEHREQSDEDEEDEEDMEDDADGEEDSEMYKDSEKAGHGISSRKIMYEDFFGYRKKVGMKKQLTSQTNGGDACDDKNNEFSDEEDHKQLSGKLSTHEQEKQKIQRKIEQLEKENLESKSWLMQGEVTATKRPKNSALEVQLDFDHNMRPVPVITEDVTASLEDMIKHRIAEERFDDVQRKPSILSRAPKERIEIDEKKSSQGLAEIYESEYMQSTGLAAAPVSSSDAFKKEATHLFKKICIKLDALSHYHFAPKPVIEDMSIQANVPALAMEEVVPLAVSDASMLAPEEIYAGKGVVKAPEELTREDRKRLRAKRKRKHKVLEKNKIRVLGNIDGDERTPNSKRINEKRATTHFAKSSKVFSDLDKSKSKDEAKSLQKDPVAPKPSFLKL